jgi:ubiquinone/menaquinone biosynthesis C-methylase UbiE
MTAANGAIYEAAKVVTEVATGLEAKVAAKVEAKVATKMEEAAEVYEERFVPALFRPWGPAVAAAALVQPGQRVLDVACGTGALTEAVCDRVKPAGSVVGLDANVRMLEVARRKQLDVEWREARAEALPFADAAFDAVVSQFGLMFFDDRVPALREMQRVLRPGGRLAVAVCDGLARSPGYAALADLLRRLFGNPVADAFRAPFALGDEGLLQQLCAQAGMPDADISRHAGTVRFPSIDALVATERACAWTLGGLLDDAQFSRLLAQSRAALAPFAAADGSVAFAMPALVITHRRPG